MISKLFICNFIMLDLCISLRLFFLIHSDATSGIDCHRIRGYIIHDNIHNTRIRIPYPELDKEEGRAFHHGRFIMGMRKEMLKEEK